MAARKIPARDLIIQVSDGQATPTWLDIAGLTSMTPNPGENEETVDITDATSGGHYEQLVMQRGASMELEGHLVKDDVTGELDPGQARCEQLAAQVGYASLGKVRFRHPMDTQWRVWTATFSLGEQGGGVNDVTSWSCTITRVGATMTEAVV